MQSLIKYFLFLFILAGFFGVKAQEDWTLARDRKGIKVFTRKAENSNLKDSKAEVVINAPIDEAYQLMKDFERHKEWMDKVGESEILKQVSDTEYFVYYVGEAPWPASDRDIIAQYKIKKKRDGKIRFEAKGVPDYIPKKDDYIRVPYTDSWWELVPISDKKVRVVYYTSSDPGGNVPDWLANTTAEGTPYDTLKEMKRILEEKKR